MAAIATRRALPAEVDVDDPNAQPTYTPLRISHSQSSMLSHPSLHRPAPESREVRLYSISSSISTGSLFFLRWCLPMFLSSLHQRLLALLPPRTMDQASTLTTKSVDRLLRLHQGIQHIPLRSVTRHHPLLNTPHIHPNPSAMVHLRRPVQ